MSIGVIAEGKGDLGVIDQLLKGITGLDTSNFKHIRPSDEFDETDLNNPNKKWSTWSLVKHECVDGSAIETFLGLEDSRFVVIHIDTDTAQDYEIVKPERNNNYCELLRNKVIEKIKEWIGEKFNGKLHYAVAVEEIEAWLLTIYANPKRETSLQANPKKALEFVLNKKGEITTSNYANYKRLSKPFSKAKEIESNNLLDYNWIYRSN